VQLGIYTLLQPVQSPLPTDPDQGSVIPQSTGIGRNSDTSAVDGVAIPIPHPPVHPDLGWNRSRDPSFTAPVGTTWSQPFSAAETSTSGRYRRALLTPDGEALALPRAAMMLSQV